MTPSLRMAIALSASAAAHAGLVGVWLHVVPGEADASVDPPRLAAHRLRVQVLGAAPAGGSPAVAPPLAPSAGGRTASVVAALPASPPPEATPPGAASPAVGTGDENDGAPETSGGSPPGGASEIGGPAGEVAPPFDSSVVLSRLEQAALRCYPERARRFGLRGETRVSFCLSGAATTERVAVTSSSGSGTLDAAATDCVLPGAQPFPHEAAGRCFTVPVVFGRTVR